LGKKTFDSARIRFVVEWHDVGAGEPQCDETKQLHERRVITKARIADACHPRVVVIDRVIDAVRSFERGIEDRNAEMVQKHRIVGPATNLVVYEIVSRT